MYRPNRIGPWPCGDIEIPPWEVGGTLGALIDNSTWPITLGAVRSVTVPTIHNVESFTIASTMTPGQTSQWAVGCLIGGVNPEPDNNIIYSISGACFFTNGTSDPRHSMAPIISKLDATPSDPDAIITITDYLMLPMETQSYNGTTTISASVNTQIIVGDIRGSTPAQTNLPIFVGWMYHSNLTTAYNMKGQGSINVHKYLEDVTTQDPSR